MSKLAFRIVHCFCTTPLVALLLCGAFTVGRGGTPPPASETYLHQTLDDFSRIAAQEGCSVIQKGRAILAILDKTSAKREIIRVAVGESISRRALVISVIQCCLVSYKNASAKDAVCLVEVFNKNVDAEKPIFRGWISHINPSANALEDQKYAIALLGCE